MKRCYTIDDVRGNSNARKNARSVLISINENAPVWVQTAFCEFFTLPRGYVERTEPQSDPPLLDFSLCVLVQRMASSLVAPVPACVVIFRRGKGVIMCGSTILPLVTSLLSNCQMENMRCCIMVKCMAFGAPRRLLQTMFIHMPPGVQIGTCLIAK